jgi:putative hydrolase of the HAD superfamily
MTASLAAVIFDWGGTLTPWHAVDVRGAWEEYARGYDPAADPAAVSELAERLLAAEEALWATTRDHHRAASLDEVFAAAGVDPAAGEHLAGLAAYHASWEQHTWTDPEAEPTLVALRARGLKIGVLSNTLWSRERHELFFERDGVLPLIDAAVYTSETTWAKPHPEAFIAAMGALGLDDPASVVFVGDRPFDDIHGAQAVGMRTVLVPHSDIPQVQRGHTEGEPDAVISRLSELVAVVDGWLGSGAAAGQAGEGLRHA